MLMVVWTPPPAQCVGGVWGLLCVHPSHVPTTTGQWSRGPHTAAAVSVTQRARGETLAPAQPPETRADRQLAGRQGHGGHFAPPDSGALGGKQTSPSPQTWTVKHQIDRRRKRQEYLHNYSGSYGSKSDTLLYPDSWS